MTDGSRWRSVRLVFSMALRETRGALNHFLFFLGCIALGVGALAGVGAFGESLDRMISREARALSGGDLQIRTTRPLSQEAGAAIAELLETGAQIESVIEMVAMASNPQTGSSLLVELKAAGPAYPFYGRLETEPADAVSKIREAGFALVEEGLLTRLGRVPGDRIVLGDTEVVIAGILRREPDRVLGLFSLGPRVLIGLEDSKRSGLVQPASRVRYRTLIRLPEGSKPEAVRESLLPRLEGDRAEVLTFTQAQPRLRRFFTNLSTYLGLAGLVTLFIGGIGVANAVRAHLAQKLDSIAILKCLGFESRIIMGIYLAQTLMLALLGSLVGIALGAGILIGLPMILGAPFPVRLSLAAFLFPALRATAMGLLVSLLFALWPIRRITPIQPLRVFRREVDAQSLEGAPRPWFIAGLIALGLAALAIGQAGSLWSGGLFVGALTASVAILAFFGSATIRLIRRIRFIKNPVIRQGFSGLRRPGGQASAAILSVGAGVAVILSVQIIEASLLAEIEDHLPVEAPSFFFLDIQPDQKLGFEETVKSRGGTPTVVPVVRARLDAVNGQAVSQMDLSGRSDGWYFEREYVLTFREDLPSDNRILEGNWWSDGQTGAVSVEEDAARHLGLSLGNELVMDVQGARLAARVTSLREVKWESLAANFYMIFSPAMMAGLPVTYLAMAAAPDGSHEAIQHGVTSRYPNVTAIDLRSIFNLVSTILRRIGDAVRFMAIFTILAGLLVLAGAIAANRAARLRESAVLKTLGATRGQIASAYAVEYAVLGGLAGLAGSLLSLILAAVVLIWIMDIPMRPHLPSFPVAIALAAAGSVAAGFLSTYRILGRRPLAVLRSE